MHKALRTWPFLLMSGFNVELPLPEENFLFQRKYLICIHFWAGRRRTLSLREERSFIAIKFNSTLLSFSFSFPYFLGFNRSRGGIRDSKKKKKKRNDANEPVPSGLWGWDCSGRSAVKAAKGGALASSPSTFPHPSFPNSVRPLAWFQTLLQLLSSRLQDSKNYRSCSQDGDPCVYCIFLWLHGGKEGGKPIFVIFLHISLLLPQNPWIAAPEPLNCIS